MYFSIRFGYSLPHFGNSGVSSNAELCPVILNQEK